MSDSDQMKFFIVCVQDTIIQIRDYIVKAHSKDHAIMLVQNGIFMSESAAETVDTVSSEIKSVEEVK